MQNLARTRTLIETIDKTIEHLKGTKEMKTEDLFAGFSVAAGEDRFGEHVTLGAGQPNDCKVSARDTGGAMCVFEFTGDGGGPPHLHHDQDEWVYVLDGECFFAIGDQRLRLAAGESIFIPRKTAHAWCGAGGKPAKIINVYQPAGNIEAFFRAVSNAVPDLPTKEDVINNTYTQQHVKLLRQLFSAHGMDLLGPPITSSDAVLPGIEIYVGPRYAGGHDQSAPSFRRRGRVRPRRGVSLLCYAGRDRPSPAPRSAHGRTSSSSSPTTWASPTSASTAQRTSRRRTSTASPRRACGWTSSTSSPSARRRARR